MHVFLDQDYDSGAIEDMLFFGYLYSVLVVILKAIAKVNILINLHFTFLS